IIREPLAWSAGRASADLSLRGVGAAGRSSRGGVPTSVRNSSIKAERRWATVDDSIFAPPLERGQSLRQALNEGSGPADPFSVAAQIRPVVLIWRVSCVSMVP